MGGVAPRAAALSLGVCDFQQSESDARALLQTIREIRSMTSMETRCRRRRVGILLRAAYPHSVSARRTCSTAVRMAYVSSSLVALLQ